MEEEEEKGEKGKSINRGRMRIEEVERQETTRKRRVVKSMRKQT